MSAGIQRERDVAKWLRDRGYLVASRRHLPGPGDLLALPHTALGEASLLLEVKATARPYERFTPVARWQLLQAATRYGLEARLAWWPALGDLELLGPDEWPELEGKPFDRLRGAVV